MDENGNLKSDNHLYMNGPSMLVFALKAVPGAIETLMAKAGVTAPQIDLFVFHQANKYILELIRKEAQLPAIDLSFP